MASRLVGTKSLSEPILPYCQFNHIAIGNRLQGNFSWNSSIFIQENAFENVVWKMLAILSQPQCVKVHGIYVVDNDKASESFHVAGLYHVNSLQTWHRKTFENDCMIGTQYAKTPLYSTPNQFLNYNYNWLIINYAYSKKLKLLSKFIYSARQNQSWK